MYLDMRDVRVRFPYIAGPEMSLAAAGEYMKRCHIRHLPVVAEGRIVGLISERDIEAADSSERSRLCVADRMSARPFVVSETSSLAEAVEIMARKKYGSVLVKNAKEDLVGIFTVTDALFLLSELLQNQNSVMATVIDNYSWKDVLHWA